MDDLLIYYRISDKGRTEERLPFINNKKCLTNFLLEFREESIIMVADNVDDDTYRWLTGFRFKSIHRTTLGNSGSFWFILGLALKEKEEQKVYFVENDYLHRRGAKEILIEGFTVADYVTLYDNPDKYCDGINPLVKDRSEASRVFFTGSVHWKTTNSTTMTFASTVKLLKYDSFVFRVFTIGLFRGRGWFLKRLKERAFPADYRIFRFLSVFRRRRLVTSIPGYSTHGEQGLLSPLTDWSKLDSEA